MLKTWLYRIGICAVLGLVSQGALAAECGEPGYFPSYFMQDDTVIDGAFELSQAYPDEAPDDNYRPWLDVDPFNQPADYMRAVLDYSLQGNIDVDFRGQDNEIRKWYHAPWLHDDGHRYIEGTRMLFNAGREHLRGMTRERYIPVGEIHRDQTERVSSWAVGMYNNVSAKTINAVWCTNSGDPDPQKAVFDEGSVGFKLLFTTATVEQVPFLDGSLEWQANTYSCSKPWEEPCWTRRDETVRLLQIDIAVKDARATKTGWFLGTFMYDASAPSQASTPELAVWDKMVPVGLAWGDDQAVLTDLNRDGAFINPDLKETWLNHKLVEVPGLEYGNQAYARFHGLGGRLNGPIDNPTSSCMSCHGQAAVTVSGQQMPMANFNLRRESFPLNEFFKYFSNVPPNKRRRASNRSFEGTEYVSLDYSLQLAAGIRDYYVSKALSVEPSTSGLEAPSSTGLESVMSMPTDDERRVQILQSFPVITRGELDHSEVE